MQEERYREFDMLMRQGKDILTAEYQKILVSFVIYNDGWFGHIPLRRLQQLVDLNYGSIIEGDSAIFALEEFCRGVLLKNGSERGSAKR
jgi:hypothetical protein